MSRRWQGLNIDLNSCTLLARRCPRLGVLVVRGERIRGFGLVVSQKIAQPISCKGCGVGELVDRGRELPPAVTPSDRQVLDPPAGAASPEFTWAPGVPPGPSGCRCGESLERAARTTRFVPGMARRAGRSIQSKYGVADDPERGMENGGAVGVGLGPRSFLPQPVRGSIAFIPIRVASTAAAEGFEEAASPDCNRWTLFGLPGAVGPIKPYRAARTHVGRYPCQMKPVRSRGGRKAALVAALVEGGQSFELSSPTSEKKRAEISVRRRRNVAPRG